MNATAGSDKVHFEKNREKICPLIEKKLHNRVLLVFLKEVF